MSLYESSPYQRRPAPRQPFARNPYSPQVRRPASSLPAYRPPQPGRGYRSAPLRPAYRPAYRQPLRRPPAQRPPYRPAYRLPMRRAFPAGRYPPPRGRTPRRLPARFPYRPGFRPRLPGFGASRAIYGPQRPYRRAPRYRPGWRGFGAPGAYSTTPWMPGSGIQDATAWWDLPGGTSPWQGADLPQLGQLPEPARRALARRGLLEGAWAARLADAPDGLLRFITRFHTLAGFHLPVMAYFGGTQAKRNAVLGMRLCRRFAARLPDIHRRGLFTADLGVGPRGALYQTIGFDLDDVHFILLAWPALDPSSLRAMLRRTAALYEDPAAVRWVFDGRLLKMPKDQVLERLRAMLSTAEPGMSPTGTGSPAAPDLPASGPVPVTGNGNGSHPAADFTPPVGANDTPAATDAAAGSPPADQEYGGWLDQL